MKVQSNSDPFMTHEVDLESMTCDCDGFAHRGSCSHLYSAAANATDINAGPALARSLGVRLRVMADELGHERDREYLAKACIKLGEVERVFNSLETSKRLARKKGKGQALARVENAC